MWKTLESHLVSQTLLGNSRINENTIFFNMQQSSKPMALNDESEIKNAQGCEWIHQDLGSLHEMRDPAYQRITKCLMSHEGC